MSPPERRRKRATPRPGNSYNYDWDGTRVELPDGQPLLTVPFIRSYDASTMTSGQVDSAVGVCSSASRVFGCAIIWDRNDLVVPLVADITAPESPLYKRLSDIVQRGYTQFTPVYVMQSNDSRSTSIAGRPYTLPTSGNLFLRRARAAAGAFELTIGVRDVYGRTTGATRTFTTRTAYGP